MSGGLGGLAAGALGLAVLETLLSTGNATRLAGVFGAPAAAARWLIDPTVPGLPDHNHPSPSSTSSPSSPAAPRPDAPTGPDRFALFNQPAAPTRTVTVRLPMPSRPAAVPVPPSPR
jgi:hypothetical protein